MRKRFRGQTPSRTLPQRVLLCSLLGLGAVHSSCALASDFALDNGIEGNWALNASVGTSVRAHDADPKLIMKGNGGSAGTSHDDGNLNYKGGDTFSTIAKVVGELSLKQDNYGLFMRAKGWHDFALSDNGVPHGSSANAFQSGAKLSDSDFDRLSRFSGVELLDAYAFLNSDLGENHPLTVKLGNQVVNWGESLFIPGINQFGAFDISASRRPGAQVKEILLPIPQVTANVGLADNLSMEGFYQFGWKKNVLDGCGTYWSISDVYNCSNKGVNVPAGPLANVLDATSFGNGSGILANAGNVNPKDSGQWGLAMRYFAPALATEFGAYYANYHQRSPTLSVKFDGSPAPSAFSAGNNRMQYAWDWSGENISVTGLSFSTGVSGWSVFGEFSHTKDLPVQLNGVDLLRGTASGVGPLAFLQATPRNLGNFYKGYDLKDKDQIQVSALKVFPRVLAAESMSLVGEVAYQSWSGIGDPNTDRRYGRAFVYGQATTATLTNCTAGGAAGAGNASTDYCENKGFATPTAWGYRLQAELSYPNLFSGVNVKPRVFWSHDVKGYSADALFLEDRQILGLGARFDYLNRYYGDLSYSAFNQNAKYDIFHDRDFLSVVVGMNF